MKNTVIQFGRVLVVTRETSSVFMRQLERRGIQFLRRQPRQYEKLKTDQGLILVINEGLERIAIPLKEQFTNAQVVVCSGGKKKFTPSVTVVHGPNDWDVHYFRGWDEFIELIGTTQLPLPKIVTPTSAKSDYYDLVSGTPAIPDTTTEMEWMFDSMSAMSIAYLEWYLQWQIEVNSLLFECHFEFGKRRRRVRKLSVEVIEQFTHKGIPVFSVDDMVVFHTIQGDQFMGVVNSISDEEMTVKFSEKLTRKQASSLQTFSVEIEPHITEKYLGLCEELCKPGKHSNPRLVISGSKPNCQASPLSRIHLDRSQWRRLNQDRSQASALVSICSSQNLVFVQGPAGTGKTFLTALAVKQLLEQGRVILLVSHSNQGLDNLIKAVADNIDDKTSIFRLGNNPANITPNGLPYHRSKKYKDSGVFSGQDWQKKQEVEDIRSRKGSGGVILACTMTSFLIDQTLKELRRNRELKINTVFVDEASRGFFYELLPIVSAAQDKVVFIGDPDQLGNIDISKDAKQYLGESGFPPEEVEYFSLGWFNTVLKEEYMSTNLLEINRRSLPVVGELVSDLFYDGRLIPGRFDPKVDGLVMFFDTVDAQGKSDDRVRTSYCNRREANLAVWYFLDRVAKGLGLHKIAIITPYRAQIYLIRQKLRKAFLFDVKLQALRDELGITVMLAENQTEKLDDFLDDLLESVVNTVDAFQGSQKQEIILSFVRSNDDHGIGFNQNINRLRVAMSRAEDRLVVIADSSTFLTCEFPEVCVLFSKIIAYIKENGIYQKVGV